MVNWEQQLGEIVRKAWHVPIHAPTFEEWLQTTGYRQIPEDLNGPLDLQSVMRTLYRQYRNEYPDAA